MKNIIFTIEHVCFLNFFMPAVTLAKNIAMSAFRHFQVTQKCSCQNVDSRDLTILGRQRERRRPKQSLSNKW
jgi:hypothetical protein